MSRSKTVQTYLAKKGAEWLSKELGVVVTIESLEFDFARNVHIEGLFMGDRAGDSMIVVNVLDLEIVKYDDRNRVVKFGTTSLKNALVKIGYHKGEHRKNIQFFIDYLNGPKKVKTTPKKPWVLKFETVKLVDDIFHIYDENKQDTEPGLIDEFNLKFSKINGTISDLRIIDDSLHFVAKELKTVERSGLVVRRLNSICNIHDKGMDFTGLDVFTACSHLQGNLHFAFPGMKYLDDFIGNTTWKGELKKSDLCLSELSVFSEDLKNHTEVLSIHHLRIGGTYDHLKLSSADIETADNSRIQGDFYLEGLPSWRTTYCEFRVKYLRTNAGDLEKIIGNMSMPSLLHDAGNIVAKGSFSGQFTDFKWDGVIESSFGNATTDVFMNFKPGVKNAIFSGRIASAGLDLSHFNSNLGVSAFDIHMDGTGLSTETFDLIVDAKIPEFILLGKYYRDAEIVGDFTAKNFTGTANFRDLRINTDFDGEINYSEKKPRFKFTANSKGLDLYELGFDHVHALVWGKTTVDLQGTDPDEMEGFVDARDVYIHRDGEVFSYGRQYVKKSGVRKNTFIEFDGNFASGTLSGNVSLNNMQAIAINSMADVFPEKIKRLEYGGLDSFDFDFVIRDPGIIYSYVLHGLKSDPLFIKGNFNNINHTAILNIKPLNVSLNQYDFNNLVVNARRMGLDNMDFSIVLSEFYNDGELQLKDMSVNGKAEKNLVGYTVKVADNSGDYHINLDLVSHVLKDSISFRFLSSELKMDREFWTVDKNLTQISLLNDGTILCPMLYLDGKDHFVEASGVISARSTDTLLIDFGNFSFDFIRPYMKHSVLDSLEGRLNGKIEVAALLGWPRFSGEISARDLTFYGVRYGDADILLADYEKSGRLQVESHFFDGLLNGVFVMGNIGYKEVKGVDQMNLNVEVPYNTNLKLIQPFLEDILTIKGGTVYGEVSIAGNFDAPEITGKLKVDQANLFIDYLKTSLKFSTDFVANKKGLFNSRPFVIYDEPGTGTAVGNLSITHKNFDKFYLDIMVDSARNLKCLNTKEGDDALFYGTAWADGDCHIYGPFEKISMDINLKSRKNSNIKVLYSDVEENELMGYIKFLKRDVKTPETPEKKSGNYLHKINVTLDINPDLDAEFVVDKRLGDIIKGRGNGVLKMLYDENEHFYMWGIYKVTEGDYVFSIPGINLLTKKIGLKEGGTIAWSGDPYEAVLDIKGSFEKKISPAALMTAVSGGSQKSYAPIKVESILSLKGNLMSPDISFDIQTPDLETTAGSTSNDVYRVIQRIRLDKDETMKQAVALMLFGNFITPSFAQNAASFGPVVSGTGVAGNSLSSIASGVVNDIFTRAGIPTRIQVNIDDVRSASGGATRVFINSEWFLTERVRLDINYDPTVAVLVNNVTVPINFNLEYMTRNENWRIRAFSRSSNLLLQQSSTTLSTGVSGNTLGSGVVYRREFDTFRPEKKHSDSSVN